MLLKHMTFNSKVNSAVAKQTRVQFMSMFNMVPNINEAIATLNIAQIFHLSTLLQIFNITPNTLIHMFYLGTRFKTPSQ
jgi:hypothetical protein